MSSSATLAIRVISDASQARKEFDSTAGATSKWGTRVGKAGKVAGVALAGGLTLAAGAAVKWGKQASDLAETQSKVNQIFGKDGAAALDRFASTAASKLGQSKQDALDAAASFGMFGKSAGLQGSALAGFSTHLTKLASDMASFNNTSPQDAAEALAAGLRGESEPLRKYGVLLDDATLRTEAMRQGLIKTTKQALTPQQKVLAAHAVIMRQTKDQQGDFARTSGGLANQQRILSAQWANFSTQLGQKALPAMVKVTKIGLEMLGWIQKHQTLVGTLVVVIGSLTAVVFVASKAIAAWSTITKVWSAVTKIAAGVQWLLNAALAANPVTLVVIAIVALVAVIVIAWKKSETFRRIVLGAWAAIKKASAATWDFIKRAISKVWDWLVSLFRRFTPLGLIVSHWAKIKATTLAVWNAIKLGVARIWAAVTSTISRALGKVKNLLTNAWSSVRNLFVRAWDGYKNIVSNTLGRVVNLVGGLKDRILRAFSNASTWLWNAGKRIIQGLIDGIGAVIGKLKDKLDTVTGLIPSWKGPADRDRKLLRPAGELIMGGLITGMERRHNDLRRSLSAVSGIIAGGVNVDPFTSLRGSSAAVVAGGGTIVHVTINGAVDPDRTARQLEKLLDSRSRRVGRR